MHISAVINHLGAWELLQRDYAPLFGEVLDVIASIQEQDLRARVAGGNMGWRAEDGSSGYVHSAPGGELSKGLILKGWQKSRPLFEDNLVTEFDNASIEKQGVLVETKFGGQIYVLYLLFSKLPFLYKLERVKLTLLLLPKYTLKTGSDIPFGRLSDLLLKMHPLSSTNQRSSFQFAQTDLSTLFSESIPV